MQLSENMTLWPEEIIKQFMKDFPMAGRETIRFNQLEVDESLGNLIGVLTLKDTGLSVIIVVKSGELTPFDLAIKYDKVVPINYDTFENMMRSDGFADGMGEPNKMRPGLQNNDTTTLEDGDGNLTFKMINGMPAGFPGGYKSAGYFITGETKKLVDGDGGYKEDTESINKKIEKKVESEGDTQMSSFKETAAGKDPGIEKLTQKIINGRDHDSTMINPAKCFKDLMDKVESKWNNSTKTAAIKISSAGYGRIVEEGIVKDLDFFEKCKFAASLELSDSSIRIAPKSDFHSVRYDEKKDAFMAKRACYAGVDALGNIKLSEEEVDVEGLDDDEKKGIDDSILEKSLGTSKDVPVTSDATITSIKKHTPFDSPELHVGASGAVGLDDSVVVGMIKKLLGFDGLSGEVKAEDCGKGFVGKGEGGESIFGKADGLKGILGDVPEELISSDKPRKGIKIIIISGDTMTEPLDVEGGKLDNAEQDKNLPNPEMKVKTKHDDEIKVKKDDSIKKMSFYKGVLSVPKDSKIVQIKEASKLKSIDKCYVTEDILKEACDISLGIDKMASRRTKIRIFINKRGGNYYVDSNYSGNGMKFSDKVVSSSPEEVKEELVRLGVSPMRAGTISRNMVELDESSVSIEAEVDSKDIDGPSKKTASMDVLKSAALLKIAYQAFESNGDYDNMLNSFGSTVIDKSQIDKYKDMANDVRKLIDELSEFALLKKITTGQEDTEQIIRSINDLNEIATMLG